MDALARSAYGKPPVDLGPIALDLGEMMHWLYLPVYMGYEDVDSTPVRLPLNLECCRAVVQAAMVASPHSFNYVYLSARCGIATRDNPLNRPGWHCDGFGTDDLNFVWWKGHGTRFAVQDFGAVSESHTASLAQFASRIDPKKVVVPPAGRLYGLDRHVVHATPEIEAGLAAPRQYVKVSLSDHRYNMAGNSHNHLFDYAWEMADRDGRRNDTSAAQRDYA